MYLFTALIRAYEENDPLAQKVVNQALKAAAALVMNLVRVSDPEAVVFGGGVMNDGWFLDHYGNVSK
ncbi:ROK family protein [uncultured Enterococcus sp.]|uniref:ROK family protein n=1 Tax=uncultured Enterococcus sp. TaxID=167972 RepID=UPI002AA636AF|nr:ROK family protein [uncultured Enterococcus sp.]